MNGFSRRFFGRLLAQTAILCIVIFLAVLLGPTDEGGSEDVAGIWNLSRTTTAGTVTTVRSTSNHISIILER